jgi:class 3 adenylate cyclase
MGIVSAGVAGSPRAARVAWLLCLATLLTVAATVVLVVGNRASIHSVEDANAIEIVLPIGFAVLGALVAARQPRNAMGWLFLTIAFLNALPGLTTQWMRLALVTDRTAPFSPWVPWVGNLTSSLVYPSGLALLVMLLIPNGRLLSPRWRYVGYAGAVVTAVLVTVSMLDPTLFDNVHVASLTNPTGVPGMQSISSGIPGLILFLLGLALLLVAGSSILLKLRRATGEERLQLRWVAYAATLSIVANLVTTILSLLFLPAQSNSLPITIVTVLGFGIAMPASFAVAILRYRLYDLDLLLNRTALYGAVTVVLAAAFFVANVVVQRILQSVVGAPSDMVAAGLGVAAGLSFGPMRRAARPVVDRLLPARSRLTLLFTDIVESTQAIVDLGDERWRELLFRYRATVRHELSRFRGREVNTAGDAFFAIFDRPVNGVRCAEAMRDAVGELGLRVRTGLHCGEVEVRGEQVSGLAVHAAARVMGLAGEGEVVISEEMAEALGGAVPLHDAGRHQLRGVPGEWQLYQVSAS